jgi:MFS family permease
MYLPRRVVVGCLLFIGLVVSYFVRMALNVAIIAVAVKEHWDDTSQGIVLSAFYWGYVPTQLLGGWLTPRYGGKLVFGFGIVWASLVTIIWPYTIEYFSLTVIIRIITGLGEGVTYPAVFQLLGLWFPKTEKSFWACFLGVAPSLGTVLANGLSPVIMDNLHWESVFSIAGGFGICWGLCWFMFATDEPEDTISVTCLRIENEELDYIINNQSKQEVFLNNPSYRKILTDPAFLVIALNHFAYNWGYYVFAHWLPTYLTELNYNLNETGIMSLLPYILMPFVAIPSGFIADKFIASNKISTVNVRKLFQIIGTFIPAFFLILLSFLKPEPTFAVIIMVIALAGVPFTTAGYNSNFLDITNKYYSLLYSISNTSANIPGIVGVTLTGYILDVSNHNWSIVFLLAAIIYIVPAVLYCFIAKGEIIDFDEEPLPNNNSRYAIQY